MSVATDLHAVETRIASLDGEAGVGRAAVPSETKAFLTALRRVATPGRGSADRPGRSGGAMGAESLTVLIHREATAANVDPRLVRAIVAAESGGDPRAVSPAGAVGAMQLMPETARALGVVDRFDLAQNIRGGTRYLRSLLDRFNGDVVRAVAAYNAGPGAVERFGGIPPYPETRRYVDRVLAAARG